MPTRQFIRLWCVKEQEWTLHDKDFGQENYVCTACKAIHTPVLLSQIPQEKLEEQRERYKKQKSHEFKLITIMLAEGRGGGISGNNIQESDAGQKEIDKAIKAKRDSALKFALEEVDKFKGAERNEACKCGSGKKYKKCCMQRIEAYQY